MGDAPPAQADPATIPPSLALDDPAWRLKASHLDYTAHYLLIDDNLLDLSHLSFAHEKTLGMDMPQWAEQRPRIEPLDRGLRMGRWHTDHPPRGFMKRKLGERVDVWTAYDFLFPGLFLQRTGFYPPGTAERSRHLRDGEEFLAAIDRGGLPQVAFYKPVGRLTQHPSYTDIQSGDVHIAEVLERLERSPQWPNMLVIVTYDENGGYWDHVPPPAGPGWGDRWGPGTRIPTLIVSPHARRAFVDHTPYDTTSILKLITRRFGLEPLSGVRRNAGDLTNALTP